MSNLDKDNLHYFMVNALHHLSNISHDMQDINISLRRIEEKLCGERPVIPDPFVDDCEVSDQ